MLALTTALAAATLAPQTRPLLLRPDAPEFQAPAPDRCLVRFDTSKGVIDIEVTRAWAPRGADRFVGLVRYGYYDEARFFRVTAGRWVQFGIAGDPAVAQAWRTRTFPDDPFTQSNVRGTVAFAFAVPNGRTTQVFINLRDNSATHDAEPFVPFGRVVAGMDVADALTSEYGEGPGGIRAGHQDPVFAGGNKYLLEQFPHLDYVKTAKIIGQAPGTRH
ncbi:MAG TPA: peptidylprolyl isomerase [Vicinamibacterales bacterium]|nr:peptidylprolyl isomerase [Vicinamibacterales bacterium]